MILCFDRSRQVWPSSVKLHGHGCSSWWWWWWGGGGGGGACVMIAIVGRVDSTFIYGINRKVKRCKGKVHDAKVWPCALC